MCSVYARSRVSRYRVSRKARQRAHDLGGSEHADVRVGLQEPARRHRHVGRAHPAARRRQHAARPARPARTDRRRHAGHRGRGQGTRRSARCCTAIGLAASTARALSRPIYFLVTIRVSRARTRGRFSRGAPRGLRRPHRSTR